MGILTKLELIIAGFAAALIIAVPGASIRSALLAL
jgi:hypothetical protein